jgi:microsomal dipeptidase-like Zn-dependent dipeptidase
MAEGLERQELEKLWGGNFLRVMAACQKLRQS